MSETVTLINQDGKHFHPLPPIFLYSIVIPSPCPSLLLSPSNHRTTSLKPDILEFNNPIIIQRSTEASFSLNEVGLQTHRSYHIFVDSDFAPELSRMLKLSTIF